MTDFRRFFPIAKVDAEQRMVYGYASTGARDDQGEIVTLDALKAALGDYMKFANIREMHQNSAVGIAKSADVDDKGLYLGAKIVDDPAWEKVREGVYKGFSIGGRVTERAAADPKTITGIALKEISLVDRPANPEATFDCWKAAEIEADPATPADTAISDALRKAAAEKAAREAARAAGPVQKWVASDGSVHPTKAEAVRRDTELAAEEEARAAAAPALLAADALAAAIAKATEKSVGDPTAKGGNEPGNGKKPYGDEDYADPGYQSDKQKRYPLTENGKPSEQRIRAAWNYIHKKKNAGKYSAEDLARIKAKIVAAWKKHIDDKGPPAAQAGGKSAAVEDLHKTLGDAGRVACILQDLRWIADSVAVEAVMEGDDSPQAAHLKAIIAELIEWCRAELAEGAAELQNGGEIDGRLIIELAAAADTLAKGDALSAAQGALLVKIRGAAPAEKDTPPLLEKLQGEVAALQKVISGFDERMQAGAAAIEALLARNAELGAEIKKLADTPLPPKTVKVPDGYTVVDKNGVADEGAPPSLSAEEAQRLISAMSPEQRAPIVLAMIQNSLKQPVNLMRR